MVRTVIAGVVILAVVGVLVYYAVNPGRLYTSPGMVPAHANGDGEQAAKTADDDGSRAESADREREVKQDSMSEEHLRAAKDRLTAEQYNVCVMGGTERPFDNRYYDHKEDGSYHCIVCGVELFSSETKYDSGSGWPAFYSAVEDGRIRELEDTSHGMVRTEVRCGNCDAHLGHLFNDGPRPTGMRYCINSASLDFTGAGEEAEAADPAERTAEAMDGDSGAEGAESSG